MHTGFAILLSSSFCVYKFSVFSLPENGKESKKKMQGHELRRSFGLLARDLPRVIQ